MLAKVVNGEFVNLAGASSGGLPVGSILALHTNRVPSGYLPCNGATYDIAQYPALYTILQTNVLPDLREMNLVGAGTNASQGITTHDVYTIGQFKDDQVQEVVTGATSETCIIDPGHCHNAPRYQYWTACGALSDMLTFDRTSALVCNYTCSSTTGITAQTTTTIECDANSRVGSTTHGKNYGVFYVIKAVTGITEIDDAEVYAQVVDLLESNYIQKSLFNEGGIPMYNSTTECFDQITPPVCNGLALSYDVTNCCYCWGETASAVSNLTDVCLSNLCDGQYLQYDATTCTWNNTTLTIDSSCIHCDDSYVKVCSNGVIRGFTECSAQGTYACFNASPMGALTLASSGDTTVAGSCVILCATCEIYISGTCAACYDPSTGILYVHAICFI